MPRKQKLSCRSGILRLHAGHAIGADLLLIGEDAHGRALRRAVEVEDGTQLSVGAHAVILTVGADHAAVKADVARRQCRNDSAGDSCTDPLYGMPLAIGYVPWQQWRKIYDPADGLANGTIFPELNLQFYGCIPQGCAKGGRL